MSVEIIITLCFSAVTTFASIIAIIATARKSKREFAERETKHALTEQNVENLQKSLDHAHDKIRTLDAKANESNATIGKIQFTLEENTRVLRKVEEALTLLAIIEERINSHMKDEK